MKRFVISDDGEADLQEIKAHLLRRGGTKLVKQVYSKLRQAMVLLAENPFSGHSRADLTDEPVLFWSVYSYLIVYAPETKPLGVARILHGSQDLETIFFANPPRF